ncbi:MAG: hypothetical protein HY276_05000 [Ignavibacteriales bacterium]|nr:hypothetical protein [Ignavibacteriales bacterium]
MTETYRRLQPVIRDPELAAKLGKAVPTQLADEPTDDPFGLQIEKRIMNDKSDELRGEKDQLRQTIPRPFAQVVGVILGSPEFQRH